MQVHPYQQSPFGENPSCVLKQKGRKQVDTSLTNWTGTSLLITVLKNLAKSNCRKTLEKLASKTQINRQKTGI